MVTVADTAYSIATIRADEQNRPAGERLFDDPYAPIFAAAGTHAAEATQRFLDLPFFVDGIRLRTRFIDDALDAALAAGLTQVVLMGAGFDARALRMKALSAPGVTVFEIDFASQCETKRALLAAADVSIPAHVRFVPCDFDADDFETTLLRDLAANGFRPGAGAVFVWEGVIGYIGNETINRSLRFMARAGGEGSRVIFTFGAMTFDPDTAATRTQSLGYRACEDIGADTLWREHLGGEPHMAAAFSRHAIATV